jgi:hypothetical protein
VGVGGEQMELQPVAQSEQGFAGAVEQLPIESESPVDIGNKMF